MLTPMWLTPPVQWIGEFIDSLVDWLPRLTDSPNGGFSCGHKDRQRNVGRRDYFP